MKKMRENMFMREKIDIAIIGASGYTGLELVRILSNHKHTNIRFVTSIAYKGEKVGKVFPSMLGSHSWELVFIEKLLPEQLLKVDVIFLCLPPLESMRFLKDNLSNIKGLVIDLGSDFRIKNPEDFKVWYGEEHILPEILSHFVYGLSEINRDKIKNSKYIANPGCYPTSVLLGLAPLLSQRDFEIGYIVIDSKSGVTGAGRKLKPEYLFCNVNENFIAYSATSHRHIGEMEQEIEKISGKKYNICFTPHLLPIDRGIFTSIYCVIKEKLEEVEQGLDLSNKRLCECKEKKDNEKEEKVIKRTVIEKLVSIYQNFYKDSYFVRFLGEKIPQVKDVVGTNMCQIGIAWDERTSVFKIFCVIDNLVKGAAGQAVQNMNIAMGFDEKEGLG